MGKDHDGPNRSRLVDANGDPRFGTAGFPVFGPHCGPGRSWNDERSILIEPGAIVRHAHHGVVNDMRDRQVDSVQCRGEVVGHPGVGAAQAGPAD